MNMEIVILKSLVFVMLVNLQCQARSIVNILDDFNDLEYSKSLWHNSEDWRLEESIYPPPPDPWILVFNPSDETIHLHSIQKVEHATRVDVSVSVRFTTSLLSESTMFINLYGNDNHTEIAEVIQKYEWQNVTGSFPIAADTLSGVCIETTFNASKKEVAAISYVNFTFETDEGSFLTTEDSATTVTISEVTSSISSTTQQTSTSHTTGLTTYSHLSSTTTNVASTTTPVTKASLSSQFTANTASTTFAASATTPQQNTSVSTTSTAVSFSSSTEKTSTVSSNFTTSPQSTTTTTTTTPLPFVPTSTPQQNTGVSTTSTAVYFSSSTEKITSTASSNFTTSPQPITNSTTTTPLPFVSTTTSQNSTSVTTTSTAFHSSTSSVKETTTPSTTESKPEQACDWTTWFITQTVLISILIVLVLLLLLHLKCSKANRRHSQASDWSERAACENRQNEDSSVCDEQINTEYDLKIPNGGFSVAFNDEVSVASSV